MTPERFDGKMAKGSSATREHQTCDEVLVYLYSRIPFLIQRTYQIATALFAAHVPGNHSLTIPQYELLDLLAARRSASQIELARAAGVDATTTGLVLKNLLELGAAERRVDISDGRRKIVSLTQQGRQMLTLGAQAAAAVDRAVALRLGTRTEWLARLLDGAGGGAPATPPRGVGIAMRLRRAFQASERRLADGLRPFGLTMRQFAALYLLRWKLGATRADMVRFLGYEASSTQLIMRNLQSRGLAETMTAGRVQRYRLTRDGEELLLRAHGAVLEADRWLEECFDGAGGSHVQLTRLLGRIIQAFDSEMRQPIPTFVSVQASAAWPMPRLPVPAALTSSSD